MPAPDDSRALRHTADYPTCESLLVRMVRATRENKDPRVQMARDLAVEYLVNRGVIERERRPVEVFFKDKLR